MYYINCKSKQGTETVDEFDTQREARAMLAEYRMAYNMDLWISSRSTRDWRESHYNPQREAGVV